MVEPLHQIEELTFISMTEATPAMITIPQTREGVDRLTHEAPWYLVHTIDGRYEALKWFNGWGCGIQYDAGNNEFYVSRKYEMLDVVAWAKIPKYIFTEADKERWWPDV